ncbi:MAG: PilZ domain-containing protein [Lysobacter sp.]|nr:MAG: PilZ domain-containing protein [Lysobacter sp.]
MNARSEESRRSRRRRVNGRIEVVDAMTEQVVGQVGNVSESGLLMLAHVPLSEDCLYQLRFALPDLFDRYSPVDVGVHVLWKNAAAAAGQAWVGVRFLSIDEGSLDRLRAWIDAPDAHYV